MAFTNGTFGQASAMRRYQEALQGAAFAHLNGNTLHCMCNGSDVAYNLSATVAWRNSDDFYPARPESHPFHVHTNAMNNLWSGTFSIPDWDMFQSGHPAGAFHAAARAISGGPVYVSDKPGRHDVALLRKLVTSDGRVLRCPQPAQPTQDCLFTDCYREPTLLKIANRNGPVGVLGAFHCRWRTEGNGPLRGRLRPGDVPGLRGTAFAVYLHNRKELLLMKRRTPCTLTLDPLGWELATVSPVRGGIAPLGLLDKLNGSAALECHGLREDGAFACTLRDGGRIGFYCARRPRRVLVNGRERRAAYERGSGLLTVRAAAGKPVDVVIR
jgi:raffinose synthase